MEHFRLLAWTWDVEQAYAILKAAPREPERLDPGELASWLPWIRIDQDYARALAPERLHEPIVLATLRLPEYGLGYVCIDGWHRWWRIRYVDLGTTILAYKLTEAESDACRLDVPPVSRRRRRR